MVKIVTVGIPVYNGARYIQQAIESVLNQTYTDFELIVTDDGSTDGTLEVLRLFDDSRLKIISDGENRGISYRLNQQISLAGGRYFVRMDADDIMMPNRLECQVNFLQNNPEVDVVGSSVIIIDEKNDLIGKRNVNRRSKDIDQLFYNTHFIHPTVAGKTSWFKKWQYSETLKGVEDYDLWIRSYQNSRFADINEPLLYYRDPLSFRLKTYLFRIKQSLRCCVKHRKICKFKTLLLIISKRFISAAIATLLTIIGLDKWMIMQRNLPLTADEERKYKLRS